MTATNGVGYEVQIYDRRIGWLTEYDGYSTPDQARAVLDALPRDGFQRRVYESLEGF